MLSTDIVGRSLIFFWIQTNSLNGFTCLVTAAFLLQKKFCIQNCEQPVSCELLYFTERTIAQKKIISAKTIVTHWFWKCFFFQPVLLSSLPLCDGGLTYIVDLFLSWPAGGHRNDTLLCRGLVAELSSEAARFVHCSVAK